MTDALGYTNVPDWLAKALSGLDQEQHALLDRVYEAAFNAGEANQAGSGLNIACGALTAFGARLGVYAASKALNEFPELSVTECTNRMAADILNCTVLTMQQIVEDFFTPRTIQ